MYAKLLLFLLICFESNVYAQEKLPQGTIQKGSLCNQKLIFDTKVGVAAKVATLGCKVPETLQMFVVKLPTGNPGNKTWQEKWMVGGCKKNYPVDITFSEDGAGGAYWTISK